MELSLIVLSDQNNPGNISGHNFGSSQLRLDEETEGCQQLGKTVAYLESAVLLQLLGQYLSI